MSFGGSKPKKAKVTPIVSPYANVNQATFTAPFGAGTTGFGAVDPSTGQKSIVTNSELTPELTALGDSATSGAQDNLDYINRSPSDQVAYATGGQDPYYNTLNLQADRALQNDLSRAKLNSYRTGGRDSTAFGATTGTLLNDDILRRNQILTNALAYGNQQANTNLSANMGTIGSLANLALPLGTASNAQFNTALQDQGRAQALTAQAQNEAEANYNAALYQYQLRKQASVGNVAGTIAGAAASFIPVVGPAIAPLVAAGTSKLVGGSGPSSGGASGSISTGGNGGYSAPFGPSNYVTQPVQPMAGYTTWGSPSQWMPSGAGAQPIMADYAKTYGGI